MKVAAALLIVVLSVVSLVSAAYFQYNVLWFIGADSRLFVLFWLSIVCTVAAAVAASVLRLALFDD